MELGIAQLSFQLPNCQNVIKVHLLRLLRNTLIYNHCLFIIKKILSNRFPVLRIFIFDFTFSYTFLYTLHTLSTDSNILHVHTE